MHRPLRSSAAVLIAGALLAAACTGDGSSALTTLDSLPPTTVVPPTTAAAATSTTAHTTTTGAPATSTVPNDVVGLSPDGPWRLVDSAPGVEAPGLVYELMPGLWVWLPVEESEEWGISWTLTEEDRPIIEAYLQARLVFFQATAAHPIDLEGPGWAEAYVDGVDRYRSVLTRHLDLQEFLDLSGGVVLRPQVIGDLRADGQAVVWDCMLDGSVWRLPNGDLGSDSILGIVPNGLEAVIVNDISGTWKAQQVSNQEAACR